jgi:hypothetical protein
MKKLDVKEFDRKNLRTPPCALRAIRIGLSYCGRIMHSAQWQGRCVDIGNKQTFYFVLKLQVALARELAREATSPI